MKNYIKLFEEFEPLGPDDEEELMSMGIGDKKQRALRILKNLFQDLGMSTDLELVEPSDDPEIGDYFSWNAFPDEMDPIGISINDEGEVGFSWDANPLPVSANTEFEARDMAMALNPHPVQVDLITREDITKICNDIREEYGDMYENLDSEEERELRSMGFGANNISWEVELEIDFDQAHQSEPEYIKSIFIGWLPEINSISDEFRVQEDSVDIDEWTEKDYLIQDDEVPTDDDIDQMRKPVLLALIDDLGLDVDADEATRASLGEVRDLIKQAIEDHGFSEMNYGQRDFIRFRLLTATENQDEVSKWIVENIIGSGRLFSDLNSLERVN